MTRPRLGVRIYAIRSKHSAQMSTSFNGTGHMTVDRVEWGIGKGNWKRDMRKAAKLLHLKGKIRVFYFIIGSRYSLQYEGANRDIQALYKAI